MLLLRGLYVPILLYWAVSANACSFNVHRILHFSTDVAYCMDICSGGLQLHKREGIGHLKLDWMIKSSQGRIIWMTHWDLSNSLPHVSVYFKTLVRVICGCLFLQNDVCRILSPCWMWVCAKWWELLGGPKAFCVWFSTFSNATYNFYE